MQILLVIFIIWCIVGLASADGYINTIDEIKKQYKLVILTLICGPIIWAGWIVYSIIVVTSKFGTWLKE